MMLTDLKGSYLQIRSIIPWMNFLFIPAWYLRTRVLYGEIETDNKQQHKYIPHGIDTIHIDTVSISNSIPSSVSFVRREIWVGEERENQKY